MTATWRHNINRSRACGSNSKVSPPVVVDPPADGPRRGLRTLIYDRLPPSASPIDTLCQPLDRYVIEHAQGDVIELTARKVSEQMQGQPHIVVTIKQEDLDPVTDADLLRLLERTHGGVLVFGVSYSLDEPSTRSDSSRLPGGSRVAGESCPECGCTEASRIEGADASSVAGAPLALIECGDCGAVWES